MSHPRRIRAGAAMALLAGCTGSPPLAPPEAAAPPTAVFAARRPAYRLQAVDVLPVRAIAVDSELATAPRARLADGALSTAWTNGGYRNATAWASVDLGASMSIASVRVKCPPTLDGSSYDLATSLDGLAWTTRVAGATSASWNLEAKPLPAGTTGRFVRLFWRNSPTRPVAHLDLYELQVLGELAGGTPTPSPAPSASPTPAPGGASYAMNLAGVAAGAIPPGWKNVQDDGYAYPWLVRGAWGVADTATGRAFRQSVTTWPWYSGAPPLSFQRFDAPTFGMAGNGLPPRYRARVVFRVRDCAANDPYYPIGDAAVQVYYLDPTHYLEVLYRPRSIDVWQCDGGQPFRNTGWTLLQRYGTSAALGQALVVDVVVDQPAGTFTVTLPGGARPTFRSPLLAGQPHWLALRASNSVIDYEVVEITRM